MQQRGRLRAPGGRGAAPVRGGAAAQRQSEEQDSLHLRGKEGKGGGKRGKVGEKRGKVVLQRNGSLKSRILSISVEKRAKVGEREGKGGGKRGVRWCCSGTGV